MLRKMLALFMEKVCVCVSYPFIKAAFAVTILQSLPKFIGFGYQESNFDGESLQSKTEIREFFGDALRIH
jgi:hypothetical protein